MWIAGHDGYYYQTNYYSSYNNGSNSKHQHQWRQGHHRLVPGSSIFGIPYKSSENGKQILFTDLLVFLIFNFFIKMHSVLYFIWYYIYSARYSKNGTLLVSICVSQYKWRIVYVQTHAIVIGLQQTLESKEI